MTGNVEEAGDAPPPGFDRSSRRRCACTPRESRPRPVPDPAVRVASFSVFTTWNFSRLRVNQHTYSILDFVRLREPRPEADLGDLRAGRERQDFSERHRAGARVVCDDEMQREAKRRDEGAIAERCAPDLYPRDQLLFSLAARRPESLPPRLARSGGPGSGLPQRNNREAARSEELLTCAIFCNSAVIAAWFARSKLGLEDSSAGLGTLIYDQGSRRSALNFD